MEHLLHSLSLFIQDAIISAAAECDCSNSQPNLRAEEKKNTRGFPTVLQRWRVEFTHDEEERSEDFKLAITWEL